MFKAILLSKGESGTDARVAEIEDAQLPEGDVTVGVDYSTINFKDGLAITGKAMIVRAWPMVPGIDFAGTVETSSHPDWKAGDKVILNGWGVGESHWGGLAQRARLKGDWLVALPPAFSTRQAAAIGTAGYTAMLCVLALERHGLKPGEGEVLVTGAAGGVGSVAIALLAKLGFTVVAFNRSTRGSGLPEIARRGQRDGSRRTVGTGQAPRQGTLGRRGRFRR